MPRISAYRLKLVARVYAEHPAATIPLEDLLRQEGVDPDGLSEANATIDLLSEAKVVEQICKVLSDKTFAARIGLAARKGDTLAAYLSRASATVGDALELVRRYYSLEDRDVEFEAQQGPDGAAITLSSSVLTSHKFPRHREFLLFGLYRRMRQVAGPDFWPLSIQVESCDEDHCKKLAELAGCDVLGGQPVHAVKLPENGFSYPIPTSDQALLEHLRHHAEERMSENVDSTPSLASRVTSLIRSQLPGRIPGGDDVAAALGMTRRTLTRRLASEGTGYKELVETARSDLAKRLILAGESIAQVAFLLDFADQAAFSVAFKRWTGTTPARFRKLSR